MTEFSYIDFEIFGERHRFRGQWSSDKIRKVIGDAHMHLGEDAGIEELIRQAGGRVIALHSIREDGQIMVSDIEEGWVE